MDITSPPPMDEGSSGLDRERRIFRELTRRLLNAALNRIFALTMEQSRLRSTLVSLLFIFAGMLFAYIAFPASDWKDYLRNFFVALFGNPGALSAAGGELLKFIWRAVTDPQTLRYLPILVLPYTLSIYWASQYLSDIFELENYAVARKFVSEVALGGSENSLVIREAHITPEDEKDSPIVLIGGPGKLSLALDSAVLVERPDGRPRVIGPSGEEGESDETPETTTSRRKPTRRPRNVLEGFERIRRDVIDLRDQVSDLPEITARTRDGIRITVADVRFVFNILRGELNSTLTQPYPFVKSAVNSLIYGMTQKAVADPVKIHDTPKSYSQGDPLHTQIKSMINGALGSFISSRNLGEFLASIATPELDAVQEQERAVRDVKKKMLERGERVTLPDQPNAPTFSPRPFLSGLVSEFSEAFKGQGEKRGVQAQWVGVGTWKMPEGIPSQVIPEKHLEAWRLTVENKQRGSKKALDQVEKDGKLHKIQQLVRNGPLTAFHNLTANQSGELANRSMIQSYIEQLSEAMTSLQKFKLLRRRPSIVATYYYLRRQMAHVVASPPPPPATPNEQALYDTLLAKVGNLHETIERLIILERDHSPEATREALLTQILKNWERDMRGQN